MNLLDMMSGSVLGALGCNMDTFLRYFPAAETMYTIFIALGMGFLLLNFVWQLFRNFGLGMGIEAEDPIKLTMRTVLFMLCTVFSSQIVNIALKIGGTPYQWIVSSDLPLIQICQFHVSDNTNYRRYCKRVSPAYLPGSGRNIGMELPQALI